MKFQSFLSVLTLVVASMVSVNANALVDVRAQYTMHTVSPDRSLTSGPELTELSGLGADAIVSLPLFPITFGLRYEQLGAEESNAVGKDEVNYTRTSAVVGMRFIDLLVYLGAIGTFGLAHSGENKITVAATNTTTTTDVDIDTSYSVGVEGGVKLGSLILGAEAGYMAFEDKDRDSTMDGIYMKAMLGYSFL